MLLSDIYINNSKIWNGLKTNMKIINTYHTSLVKKEWSDQWLTVGQSKWLANSPYTCGYGQNQLFVPCII